jgi:hypothetical protein
MSIAILRRRLWDRARVRWRTTKSWLLRRKQRSAYNTLLKELHTEDPNEFRNYFRKSWSHFVVFTRFPSNSFLRFFDKDEKKTFDSDNRHFVQVFFDKVFDGKL